MSVKSIVIRQYRDKVNRAALQFLPAAVPPEGWICTVRKALGMSAAALARRLRKTRALVSNTEKAEMEGGVTLKTMQAMAEAMHCRFVYAIVPEGSVEAVLDARAQKKAHDMVLEASRHMALEEQRLSGAQLAFETDRIKEDLLREMPPRFWDDES